MEPQIDDMVQLLTTQTRTVVYYTRQIDQSHVRTFVFKFRIPIHLVWQRVKCRTMTAQITEEILQS